MNKKTFAVLAAAMVVGTAAPSLAQLGPYRRFTQPAVDPNRNEIEIYVPLVYANGRDQRGTFSHMVSVASWLATPVGAAAEKPDLQHKNGEFVLERFAPIRQGREAMLEVVIRGNASADATPPAIRITHSETAIGSSATAQVTAAGPGMARYRFVVRAPHYLLNVGRPASEMATQRYDISLLPRSAEPIPSLKRNATFAGQPREYAAPQAPSSTVRTSVAGERQESRRDPR